MPETFQLRGVAKKAGQAADGLAVAAYKASSFSTLPEQGTGIPLGLAASVPYAWVKETVLTATQAQYLGQWAVTATDGNSLVAALQTTRSDGSAPQVATVTDDAGNLWQLLSRSPFGDNPWSNLEVWVTYKAKSPANIYVKCADACTIDGVVDEFSGMVANALQAIAPFTVGTNATPTTDGSQANVNVGDLVVAIVAQSIDSSVTFSAQSAGYTPKTQASSTSADGTSANGSLQLSFKIETVAQAQQFSLTRSAATNAWGALLLIFNANLGTVPLATPDAGPVASGLIGGFPGSGEWQLAVPTTETYYVCIYDFGTLQVYHWEVTKMPTPHSSLQIISAGSDQSANRIQQSRTIASTSNGVVLPTASIDIVGGPMTGPGIALIQLTSFSAPYLWTAVAFAASVGNTLTGCSGGSGTLATGNAVILGYQASKYRRLVTVSGRCGAPSSVAGAAYFSPVATLAGILQLLGLHSGWQNAAIAGSPQIAATVPFVVDPFGYYGIYPFISSNGAVTLDTWIEADF